MQKAFSVDSFPEVLSVKDIAEILGIGYQKSVRTIKYTGMDYFLLGNSYKVSRKNFVEWLHTQGQRKYTLDEQ